MSGLGPDVAIPRSMEEMTPTWLSGALQSGGIDVDVATLDATPIGVGVGIMSMVFRLRLTYERGEGPPSLVVKIAPPYEIIRMIAAGYGMYKREVQIYRELGVELGLAPRFYFGAFDEANHDFVIIIGDLGHLRSTDQIEGCSVDDARTIVTSLAEHHAKWWNSERLYELPYLQPAGAPPWPQFNDQSFQQSWPVIVERFGELVPQRIASICDHWSDFGPVMMEDTINHPVTFCHGDMRLDNIFFGADPVQPITIVDWQIANIGPGINDVAYFMSQSLTTEVRRASEHELLGRYHDHLTSSGIDYPFEDLWDDYRRCLVFCLTYPIIAGAGELVNEHAFELCRTILRRCVAAIIETDADEIGPIRIPR